MLRKFFFILPVLAFVFGCSSNRTSQMACSLPKGEIVSPQMLKGVGLELSWQNDLPFRTDETVKDIFVAGDHVYVLSSRNVLFCVKRSQGTLRFSKPMAAFGLPISGPVEDSGMLYFYIGKDLTAFNPDTAELEALITHRIYPVGLPAINSTHYYLASTDSKVWCFDRTENLLKHKVSACTDNPISSVLANENSLYIVTKAGNIFSSSSLEAVKNWQFNLGGCVVAQALYDGENIYIPSLDSNLYKLSASSGTPAWKIPLGDELRSDLVKIEDILYIPAGKQGLYAINADNGSVIWQDKDAVQFLSQGNGKVYLLTSGKLLSVMDNQKQMNLHKINISNAYKAATNKIDSDIYVVSKDGSLAKIKPAK